MSIRSFLGRLAMGAAIAGFAVSAHPASAASASPDAALLGKVTDYLNSIKTVTARFVQVAQDGSIRNGQAILQRPGKMRFQYDPPDPQLLVAGFGLLVYHDPQLNQTTNIPLSATPLGMLLAKHVRFSGPVTVTKLEQPPGEVQVTLIRTGKAAQGHLTLVFSTKPLELRQWRVTDAQGRTTQVSLYDLHATKPFPNKDFEYVAGFTPGSG
jgi:outer membrane lipoprotein-sorting protein